VKRKREKQKEKEVAERRRYEKNREVTKKKWRGK
jgi:hypothetical protein